MSRPRLGAEVIFRAFQIVNRIPCSFSESVGLAPSHPNLRLEGLAQAYFLNIFKKTQGQKNSASKKTKGHFSPQNEMHRKFLRLQRENSMHWSFLRLHQKNCLLTLWFSLWTWIFQKTQCFGGYQPQSASKKMFKKLAWNRARLSRVASCKNLTVNIRQVAQRVCCGTHSTSKN